MSQHLKNSPIYALLALMLCTGNVTAKDNPADMLPDIGTTAGSTLSVSQELQMGDYYVRQLRASAPLINDPLLDNYINQLGQRLVAHAFSVRMPFHFYLVNNSELNAFAFFGGNVVLHSALFHIADTESQLASVMAHEISHVTQRHLARAMEEQKRNAPLTWVGALGSMLLAMANPQAGMAVLTGTLAGSQQGIISFTQANEKEADRIGIQVLQRAGFNPQAMPDFLQKLADQSRFSAAPPEILLTHPLPDSRLADARNRANQMHPSAVSSSVDFYLAKARLLAMYASRQEQATTQLFKQWAAGNSREQLAAQYGKAIQFLEKKQPDKAAQTLAPLLAKQPDNIWFLDVMTDIAIAQKQPQRAIEKLQAASALRTSPVLQLNLANAQLEAGQPAAAVTLLNHYTFSHPDDPNAWDLLARACAMQNKNDDELAARAEGLALTGQFEQAIMLLSRAGSHLATGSLQQARFDARIDQLRQLQLRFRQYQKG